MNKSLLLASLTVLFSLLVWACSKPDPVRSHWHDISSSGWAYGNKLVFNTDSLPVDTIAVSVRHTAAYPYANLWLEVAYATADTLQADTFNIELADDFGRWYGHGSGVSFQRTVRLIPTRTVNIGSPLTVRHIMRVDTLPEVEQIGIAF